MKSYKYLSATYGWGWVTVESIDSTVLDWILAKLQEFLPGCAVKDREELSSGETYRVDIDRFKGNDKAVKFWIVKQLCLQGWEPFFVDEYSHHLRLEVADNGEDKEASRLTRR